jgi:hypothetical protein
MSFVSLTALEGWTDLSTLDELHRITGFRVFYSVDSGRRAWRVAVSALPATSDSHALRRWPGRDVETNRSAYKGANGNATEIGHVPIVPDARPYCGNRGCLERYLCFSRWPRRSAATMSRMEAASCSSECSPIGTRRSWEGVARPPVPAQCDLHDRNLLTRDDRGGRSVPKALLEHIVDRAQPLHGSYAPAPRSRRADPSVAARRGQLNLGAAVLPIYEMLSPSFEMPMQQRPEQSRVEAAAAAWPADSVACKPIRLQHRIHWPVGCAAGPTLPSAQRTTNTLGLTIIATSGSTSCSTD